MCCPCEVQGLLCRVLEVVKDRDSSPIFMLPGPALPQFPVEGRGHFYTALRHQHVPRWQSRSEMSVWPLMVTNARPSQGPWWQHGPGLHLGPRWHPQLPTSGCSSLASSLQLCCSLHCAHVLPFLFLFPISLTLTFTLKRWTSWSSSLASSLSWLHYSRVVVILGSLLAQAHPCDPIWGSSGSPCQGYTAPDGICLVST